MFDGSEALRESVVKKLDGVIKLTQFDRNRFYLITGSLEADDIFSRIKEQLGVGSINFLTSNIFVDVVVKNNEIQQPTFNLEVRRNLCNCLNRSHRAQRGLLVAALIENDLKNSSIVSMYGPWDKPNWIETMTGFMNLYDPRLTEIFRSNKDIFPLHVNASKNHRENPIFVTEEDRYIYENTYFSLVTETIFFTDRKDGMAAHMIPGIFITEKTYKPISMKHPFIILSVPFFLKKLRELGFKTFHPFINESYDEELDDMKRFYKIIDEVKRLAAFTDSEWLTWQEQIKEIVEFNFQMLYNMKRLGLSDTSKIIERLERNQ